MGVARLLRPANGNRSAHEQAYGFRESGLVRSGPQIGTSAFHDITSGSNGAYSAHAGYDNVTGIGSIKGYYFSGVE